MRKLINITALIVFIWLLLDAFNIPNMLLNFLLAGEIPVVRIALPPSMMLAIITTVTLVVIFELLAKRIGWMKRIRQSVHGLPARIARQPHRLGRA